jgi:hypothetical protein
MSSTKRTRSLREIHAEVLGLEFRVELQRERMADPTWAQDPESTSNQLVLDRLCRELEMLRALERQIATQYGLP